MNKKYLKKLIGTSLMIAFIIAVSLISFSLVKAQYLEENTTLVFDGTIAGIDGPRNHLLPDVLNLAMAISGSAPIDLQVDGSTVYAGGLDFSDLMTGDFLKVNAKINGSVLTAKVIKREATSGYGNPGKQVVVHEALFVASDLSTITVDTKVTRMTFSYNVSTKFIGTNLESLDPGDKLKIIGEDSGSALLANQIIGNKIKIKTKVEH